MLRLFMHRPVALLPRMNPGNTADLKVSGVDRSKPSYRARLSQAISDLCAAHPIAPNVVDYLILDGIVGHVDPLLRASRYRRNTAISGSKPSSLKTKTLNSNGK